MLQRLKFFPHWFRLVAWILLSGVLLIRVAAAAPNTALPASRAAATATPSPLTGWAAQISTDTHTCALTLNGGVECWGANTFGQLGDGTTQARMIPTRVIGLPRGVQAVAVGGLHTCALAAEGAVWCWGRNDYGQLGDGAQAPYRSTPGIVTGLSTGVRGLTAGSDYTCALGESGSVQCWGNNQEGQLGDGTKWSRWTPVAVGELPSDVQALTAGGEHTCAVTAGSHVYCWGDNSFGQLGDGTTVTRTRPVALVYPISGISAVSAGGRHTCVLAEGRALCWGGNYSGQLGDGTTRDRLTPAPVVGLPNSVANISAGPGHTCATLADGSAWCWGVNYYGELGDGTTVSSLTPVAVADVLDGVSAISAGNQHTCAVTRQGGVKCWGANLYGELGDGTLSDHYTPTDVWHFDCAQVSVISPVECQALVDLFTATWLLIYQPWNNDTGWLREPSPCDWYGVTCANGHVTQLNLSHNSLYGPLPATLDQLSALQSLNLSSNYLTGPLPPALGHLVALQDLDLHSNTLSGPLPSQMGALTALQTLDLSANALIGLLPAELTNLVQLRTLNLSANLLSGTLPADLSRLTALRTLNLSRNLLSGLIPFRLADLGQLTYLDLSHNNLTELLPFWDYFSAPALQYLDLSNNQLVSPISWYMAGLTALTYLDLSGNNLGFPIPRQLGNLTALTHLDLHANRLTDGIPPDLGNLHALTYLDLSANHLTYNIPAELGGIGRAVTATTAITIDLASNHLFGAIPATLGGIAGLRSLDLSGNQLSGAVPTAITERPLAELDLNYNQLAPTDPRWSATQTVAPTDLRGVVDGTTVLLTWTPIQYTYFFYTGAYEISYATAPGGPFTVAGDAAPKSVASYTVTGLPPAAVYYFRVRTFSPAQRYTGADGAVLYQPNNLWSDYTPLVSVYLGEETPTATPTATPTPTGTPSPARPRVFLPLIWR